METKETTLTGQDIVDARRRLNLSQEALAKKLNVTQPCLSHYETGRREIPRDRALQISSLFSKLDDQYESRNETFVYRYWKGEVRG